MFSITVTPAEADIQNPIIGESILIPACTGTTKDGIHLYFKKRDILAYLGKEESQIRAKVKSATDYIFKYLLLNGFLIKSGVTVNAE